MGPAGYWLAMCVAHHSLVIYLLRRLAPLAFVWVMRIKNCGYNFFHFVYKLTV